jgi:hypothetical protein
MATFTLNLSDSAGFEVSLTRVEDTVKKGLYHIYISRLFWESDMADGRNYRMELDPGYKTAGIIPHYYVAPGNAYLNSTNAEGFVTNETILLTGPADANNPFIQNTGTKSGDFTQSSLSAGNYIGSYRSGAVNLGIQTHFVLKESEDGTTWNTISEADVENKDYTFSWDGNGALNPPQSFTMQIVLDQDTANHPDLPRLYVRPGIVPEPAGETITIGYHSYLVYADPGGKVVNDADFTLHRPRDDLEGGTTAEVDDFDTTTIPGQIINLFNMALQKTAFTVPPTYSNNAIVTTNSDPYIKHSKREALLHYYANIDWHEVWIREVEWVQDPDDAATDILSPVYSTAFSLQSTFTTFTVAKQNTNSVHLSITPTLGSNRKTVIKSLEVVPFVPVADRNAPIVHLSA